MTDGERFSWVAIKAPLTTVIDALDLRNAAPVAERPKADNHILHLKSGWIVVWWGGDHEAAKDPRLLAKLSRRGEAVAYAADRRDVTAFAAIWRRGSEVWSIEFDEDMGEFLTTGNLPMSVGGYEEEEFDAPRMMVGDLTGFDPERPPTARDIKGIYVFQPPPPPKKRPFLLWRLLGLARG